jgi:uncharacterized SAM-binding protein YcdF (DUF218 family)
VLIRDLFHWRPPVTFPYFRGKMIIVYLLGLLLLLLLALFSGRGRWLPAVGRFLVVADPLAPAAAVVPLAGSGYRVVYAAELFNQGYAAWFVATDMPINMPGIAEPYSGLVKREAIRQGVPETSIFIAEEQVRTTYAEARAVRHLAESQGWQSLLLVTSASHTRRARLIFRQVFHDSDIRLTVRPVVVRQCGGSDWWQTEDGLRETWTEYVKLLLYLAGYHN